MEFERKIIEISASLAIIIPVDLTKYFELEKGTKIIIEDDENKIIIRKRN